MRSTRYGPFIGVLAIWAAASTAVAQPEMLDVGGRSLPLKSQATRSEMFGLVDLYQVALYAPANISSVEGLRPKDVPKALRVEVQYNGSLPDEVPSGWRSELDPALNKEQSAKLRSAYAKLEPKDEILITYVPERGTTLRVSGNEVLTNAGYEVMAAFLDIWLGQTPVSEDVKDALGQF